MNFSSFTRHPIVVILCAGFIGAVLTALVALPGGIGTASVEQSTAPMRMWTHLETRRNPTSEITSITSTATKIPAWTTTSLLGSVLAKLTLKAEAEAASRSVVAEVAPPLPVVPPRGHATAYGCNAAIAYLGAYAAPGFVVQCPAYAGGHQATTTCVNGPGLCSGEKLILIADPCPAAYMNEASNSFVITGLSEAPIDPYGDCY